MVLVAGSTIARVWLSERDTIVTRFVNARVVHDASAVVNVLAAVAVYPAVAPSPRVAGPDVTRHLTYEPLRLRDYDAINGVGAIAWLILLLASARRAWEVVRPREVLLMPIGWLLFNTLFHSMWGDEFFLYTPHWSWALMGLVMLGAGSLRPSFVLVLSVLVGLGQVHTLRLILAALAPFGS